MSFGIQAAGTPSQVIAELAKRHNFESQHGIAIKEVSTKLLEHAPAESLVVVEASGHHNYGAGQHEGYVIVDLRFRVYHPPVII